MHSEQPETLQIPDFNSVKVVQGGFFPRGRDLFIHLFHPDFPGWSNPKIQTGNPQFRSLQPALMKALMKSGISSFSAMVLKLY